MGYYSVLITENHSNPKSLFSNFDIALHRKSEKKFPHSHDNISLANAFADFFTDKITAIREELQLEKNAVDDRLPEPPPYSGDRFCEFQLVSIEELSNLVCSSGFKSCALDPIPAQVLKGCLDLLLPFIT